MLMAIWDLRGWIPNLLESAKNTDNKKFKEKPKKISQKPSIRTILQKSNYANLCKKT